MTFCRSIAVLVFTTLLVLSTDVARAQAPANPLVGPSEELSETQARREHDEGWRLYPQILPDDAHQMIEREVKRAYNALVVVIGVGLMLFVVFALPLSVHDKIDVETTLARSQPTVAFPVETTFAPTVVRLTWAHSFARPIYRAARRRTAARRAFRRSAMVAIGQSLNSFYDVGGPPPESQMLLLQKIDRAEARHAKATNYMSREAFAA
jgi:hypothetical protein